MAIKYQPANIKLARLSEHLEILWNRKPYIYGISLPAGHSCPFADKCLSKADRKTGKLTDGPNTEFRCFMASIEALRSNSRNAGWENFDQLRQAKTVDAMLALLEAGLPKNADVVRLGVNGDMFNQNYFDACLELARRNPNVSFYAYTKSLGYWVARLGQIPANLNLNASHGGKLDNLIQEYGLKSAVVVFHPSEAEALGLEIDHDETHALFGSESFALLIHGQQPKGSTASDAIKTLKAEKIEYAYKAHAKAA